ncbi:hypothetical protein [Halomonas halmophila]|uniref:Uncharacterized protein n=1 Tax=Halomonas halmophila TaxID=252 RepID=A0A4Y4EZI8_9GAMM|nr:hypothetical protein [Halomonas halmophila]GED22556.1 hypothetical protein HHA01_15330 [Halomonas halmophila]
MKYQNSREPHDERDKLRKFRELDDAFAEALRDLEQLESPSRPSDQASAQPGKQVGEQDREAAFKRQLESLMQEYALPADSVSDLLVTMKSLGRIS